MESLKEKGIGLTEKFSLLLVFNLALIATAVSQGLDTTDYFPLNVGDIYSYRNAYPCPPDTVRERYYPLLSSTIDTVWIEGKKYFVQDRFFLSPDTLRIDKQGNVVMRNWGEDKVFYRMNAAVGDTWSFSLRNHQGHPLFFRATLQSRSDSISVHAGQFQRCLRFRIYSGVEPNDDWLAPGIGLAFRCVQEPIELYEAQVKGIKYPLVTSVEENKFSPMAELALYQNYPNPFNTETTIEYSIPTKGVVNIEVYNVLGQKVRTLLSQQQETGRHQVVWDGKDDNGRAVSSGVYLIRVRCNSRDQVIHAVYLR